MDKPMIMVVDDSEVSLNTLREFFTEAGCEVICEESGEGAWLTLNAGRPVDLMILDWHMPQGMSGPQLNKKIQGDERFSSIPVVAFTSRLGNGKDSPDAMEWVASFSKEKGSRMEVRENREVAKSMGLPDAGRIPAGLVIAVVERLKEAGKTVPPILAEAAGALKSRAA
jgi:CheY-like chemotaxis protein